MIFLYRKGSIIAEFELIFKNEPEEPLKPIKERIKDGKLGELEVEADSLRLRDEQPKGIINIRNSLMICTFSL